MTAKGKHLTLEDRTYIEDALNENYSLKHIAMHLEKDSSTISKEVKRNRVTSGKVGHTGHLSCQNRKSCQRKHICTKACDHLCKKCMTHNCYRICPDYMPKSCMKTLHFPHVCNGCIRKVGCTMQKYKYRGKVAQANYMEELRTSRKGIALTPKELTELDALISPRILKGQSITHIYAHHNDEIKCSKITLYAYFEQNLFTARNIDLPRKVKYKPRKKRTQTLSRGSAHTSGQIV